MKKVYLPLSLYSSLDGNTLDKIYNSTYSKKYGIHNTITDESTGFSHPNSPFVIVTDDLYSKFSSHIDVIYDLLKTVQNQESELTMLREIRNNVEAMRKLLT